MIKTRVIPVMLFRNSFVGLVKSIQFDRFRTIGNPINAARVYNSRKVDELVFLDIGAQRDKRPLDHQSFSEVLKECFMPVSVGGNITTVDQVRQLLRIGADKVSINTAVREKPSLLSEIANSFGSQTVIVSIDAKREKNGSYRVYTHGGQTQTPYDPVDWALRAQILGAGELLVTSIDRDGMMGGYDIELISSVTTSVSIPVIACGGAGKPAHMVEVMKKGKADAVAAASIFHFTQFTPNNIREALSHAGIPVRASLEQ